MKQVIKLNENDLTNIIKKVLKEQASAEPLKVRVFNKKDDLRNNVRRACNLDISQVTMRGNGVDFYFKVAGENGAACNVNGVIIKSGYGTAACGDSTYMAKLGGGTQGHLSPEAYKSLTAGCSAYASAGNQEDNNYV